MNPTHETNSFDRRRRSYLRKGLPTRGPSPGTWKEFAAGLEDRLITARAALRQMQDASYHPVTVAAICGRTLELTSPPKSETESQP